MEDTTLRSFKKSRPLINEHKFLHGQDTWLDIVYGCYQLVSLSEGERREDDKFLKRMMEFRTDENVEELVVKFEKIIT